MTSNRIKEGADVAPVTSMKIQPPRWFVPVNIRELIDYRQLLYFFTWRDIKIRYKQTIIGAAWAVIQPLAMMVVFTLFFGNLAKIPSLGIPYPLFNYAALLPWMLFAEGLNRSTNSLVADTNLIKKIYFPRLILPITGVISPIVDFAIAFIILIGMMFYYGYVPTVNILYLPLLILLALLTALGVGLWLSAINVRYRDIRYATPFLVQLWLFASPVVYDVSLLPERFQAVYALNPMVGVIQGFRWALLGTEPPSNLIVISVVIVFLLLVSGAYYFRHNEKTFADIM